MRRLFARLLIAAAAIVVIAPAVDAVSAAPATAAMYAPATFTANLCEGTTTSNPKQANGVVGDLSLVFGQKLRDFNAGTTALLYGNAGGQGGTPNCGVRYVAETGAVSEWMYCTDYDSKYCSGTDKGGRLTQAGTPVGSLATQAGNTRLSATQQQIITHLIRVERPVTVAPFMIAGNATEASNADSSTRMARQLLVWCISEQDSKTPSGLSGGLDNETIGEWCATNIGVAAQAKILASAVANPTLEIVQSEMKGTSAQPGTARVTVTSNLVNQPISLSAGTAAWHACIVDHSVELVENTLTVHADAPKEYSIDLCAEGVTPDGEGGNTLEITAEVHLPATAVWVQSPGTDTITCQVYALTAEGGNGTVAASTRFTVLPVLLHDQAEEPAEDSADGPVVDPTEEPAGRDQIDIPADEMLEAPAVDEEEVPLEQQPIDVPETSITSPAAQVPSEMPAVGEPKGDTAETDRGENGEGAGEGIADAPAAGEELSVDPAGPAVGTGAAVSQNAADDSQAAASITLAATGAALPLAAAGIAVLLMLGGIVMMRRRATAEV